MNIYHIRWARPAALVGALLLSGALAGCAAPSAQAPTPVPATLVPATPVPATRTPVQSAFATLVPVTRVVPQATPVALSANQLAGAVQTVINYYVAIEQKDYARAYGYWSNNGAASNQTFDQFQQGFASTAGSNLQLDMPVQQGADVAVPVRLASVINDATVADGQRVQHFSGTYTLRPDSGSNTGWRLVGANIAEGTSSLPAAPADDPNGAQQALQLYYDAIRLQDYALAYTLWADFGAGSKQSFLQFQQGFASTASVTLAEGQAESEGAAGSIYATVPAVVLANAGAQGAQTFCGTYTLRRANVPPFDQFGWHITDAQIAAVANVQPGSPQVTQLLSSGCK